MSLHFSGKHCAVVGATGAIGFAIAKAFAQQGALVSLLGRRALEARSDLQPRLPSPGHRFFRLDLTDHDGIKDTFSSKPGAVGPLDILVNCAGISQTAFLKRTSDEELVRIVDTNLVAAMLTCKHAKVQPNGCIINVSSLMAVKGGLGATAYAASKAGLIGFTRALCREMAARSIRVNALLPGWVDTPMWTDLKPELQQQVLKDTPLNRVANPDEIAEAAVFLASNGFANNCILNLDGGLSAA